MTPYPLTKLEEGHVEEEVQDLKLQESPKDPNEPLYWEKDDTNPNQVIYDLEKGMVIILQSEDEITND